jgi:hypothetical protein
MTASPKLRRALVLALAGGSLAIGVPAALATAGGDAPAGRSGTPAPATFERFIQDGQDAPDREDCPERGGGAQDGADATAPADPSV